jgi:tungstate transport system ATP-binding protein
MQASLLTSDADTLAIRFDRACFEAGGVHILDRVDLELRAGAPTVVIGPNGSGKTTLIKLAMGLVPPTRGTVSWGGAAGQPGGRALVFQKPVMLRRTVADNIAYARRAAGLPASDADILRLLEFTHVAGLAERPARRLSGGEQQRVALARALAREPRVLLLDEPTASLDPAATKLVEEILARVSADGVKIVMSTHDLGQARRIGRQVVFMAKGRVVEHAPADRFFAAPASAEARSFLAGELVV